MTTINSNNINSNNINSNNINSNDINNNPSICIPRVYYYIQKSFIQDIFQIQLKFGKIKKIDIINTNDKKYKKIFIHFDSWNSEDGIVNSIKQKLLLGHIIKIVYDFPWFWKCSLYRPSL
jgi:hypothetical protein